MPDRRIEASVIAAAAEKMPRRPHAWIARIICGDPVEDVVVVREARVVELDADEKSSSGDGVNLVVDTLLRVEGGGAAGPVRSDSVSGENWRGKSVWLGVVVISS